ncbi:class I SAM-dependent methyltransferase [Mesorhizobium sp. M1050]|uniref:class I SAM-dependent methyltransferase n=1 Tax=Mesorhizobium sp. M1050 TaxID=2957051 RepID=UPI00333B990F
MTVAKEVLNSVHSNAVFGRRIRVLARHIAGHLEAGSVLDVGCGDGTLAKSIMEIKPTVQIKGIDVFLRPSVAIPATIYDGVTIPFPDNSVDWVTIVDVLHHTDDPSIVIAECARVARRGVVIKDHLRDGFLANQTLRFMDWVGNRGHDVRLPYNYLSSGDWGLTFKNLGLVTVKANRSLGIYPPPFTYLFDRGLHFVATVAKRPART